jgi:hypothetical protein
MFAARQGGSAAETIMPKSTKKSPNAQDATLINIRSLKRRVLTLENRLRTLTLKVTEHRFIIKELADTLDRGRNSAPNTKKMRLSVTAASGKND